MGSQLSNLNIIANNIANVNTSGFKSEQAGFSSLMYKNLNGGDGTDYIGIGHGVKLESTGLDLTQSELASTDIDTDYAIQGDGFFALQNPDTEELFYTRSGSFKLKADGETNYLVDSNGNNVLNADGEAIEYSTDTTTTTDTDTSAITPGVYKFPDSYALEMKGGNQFVATTASGEAEAVDMTAEDENKPKVVSGYLENSNVDVSTEMVHMIEAQRGFSLNSKVIQAADDIEKTVNQLR